MELSRYYIIGGIDAGERHRCIRPELDCPCFTCSDTGIKRASSRTHHRAQHKHMITLLFVAASFGTCRMQPVVDAVRLSRGYETTVCHLSRVPLRSLLRLTIRMAQAEQYDLCSPIGQAVHVPCYMHDVYIRLHILASLSNLGISIFSSHRINYLLCISSNNVCSSVCLYRSQTIPLLLWRHLQGQNAGK